MYKYSGVVDGAWWEHPAKAKQRKGASPMDGARVTPRKDANGNVLLEQRDEQLVLSMRSLGDGIFIHPNRVFSVVSDIPAKQKLALW